LSLEELDGRLDRAYAAQTYADLEQLVADLPAPVRGDGWPSIGPTAPAEQLMLRITAGMGDEKRAGKWVVPPHLILSAPVGSVKVDFTEPSVPCRDVFVEARTGLGSVTLVLPPAAPPAPAACRVSWAA
jgi:hypothetical protein